MCIRDSEDAQGLPFVGRSGQLLDHYLEAIDLDPVSYTHLDVYKRQP